MWNNVIAQSSYLTWLWVSSTVLLKPVPAGVAVLMNVSEVFPLTNERFVRNKV